MIEPMVACGGNHTIFIKNDGSAWGCGNNGAGQLGLGDKTTITTPVKLTITNVKQAACGSSYVFIIKNDGKVWSCGYNLFGQLGLGDTTDRKTPVQLDITNVKQIAAGYYHAIFVKNDGTFWGCGKNNYGQLGLGDAINRLAPVKLNITNVRQVACGSDHTIFLKNDGTVWGCGCNAYGQLGLGDTITRTTPVQLNITDVKQIACGGYHTIFLKTNGLIYGCGRNDNGQLGLGKDTTHKYNPTNMTIGAERIVCGDCHTVFLEKNGNVWYCGLQRGSTISERAYTPIQLNIKDVKQIACGYNHTILLKNDGTVWGYGYNSDYQLGLGNTGFIKIPEQLDIRVFALPILLYDANYYKTISGNILQILEEQELNADNFEHNGFTDINDIQIVWEQLSEQFDVLIYDVANANNSIAVNHLPTTIMMPKEDIDVSKFVNIKSIALTTTGDTGTVKLALSFDKGVSWRTYANGWQDIALTTDALMTNGLTPAALSAITMAQWMSTVTGTLRIAYVLSKTSVSDDIAIDSLTITGDTATWVLAGDDDYTYSYSDTKTMIVQLLQNGSYKINYMESK